MLITSGRTIPVPIVAATAVPDIVPSRLNTLAISKARDGERTRVETTVAMALGASVHPLTNSAARISTSTRTVAKSKSIAASSVLEHDTFYDVRHILSLIRGLFQQLIEFPPLNNVQEIRGRSEELFQTVSQFGVREIFKSIDLNAMWQYRGPGNAAQQRHDNMDLASLLADDLG